MSIANFMPVIIFESICCVFSNMQMYHSCKLWYVKKYNIIRLIKINFIFSNIYLHFNYDIELLTKAIIFVTLYIVCFEHI